MRKLFLSLLALCAASVIQAQNVSGNCYRGFADAGYTIGIGDYCFGRVEINTSHGYQINPFIYIGAGAGIHFMQSYSTSGSGIPLDTRKSMVDIPVFANIRCNMMKTKVAPFIDVKAGTYITNSGGLYANISLGCRIATNSRQAVNISFGYTSEKLEFQTFNRFSSITSMNYTRKATKYNAEGITLKIGYEL